MSLCKYVKEIESLEFQIQFSVIGGIEILQLAMERHPTLMALRSEIATNEDSADAVFRRILLLLEKVEAETQLSYDESIAAYLFCLFKEKPISAYRASWRILDYGGLWWSVQLAHHVKEMSRQILESMDMSDNESETVPVGSADSLKSTGDQRVAYTYDAVRLWAFSLRSEDFVMPARSPDRITFGNKARAKLPSKKTFEIGDSSNRQGYFDLVH